MLRKYQSTETFKLVDEEVSDDIRTALRRVGKTSLTEVSEDERKQILADAQK